MSFIYTLIVSLILISSIYEYVTNSEVNKTWFYTIITLMIVTAGITFGLSPDWFAYYTAFQGTIGSSFSEVRDWAEYMDMEVGYMYLNKVVSMLGFDYATFTLLIAAIALILKSLSIFRYGGYVFMALLMYTIPTYFFEEHVHVRQGLAAAISLFSIRYIIERKFWKFFLCFLIAFLFHKSVIAFLFAYWIVKIRFNNWMIIGLVASSIIANILGLSQAIDGLMRFLPFGVGETYADYANEFSEKSILGDIVKVLTVIAILMFNNIVVRKDELFSYFRNIYLFGVVIYFFFGDGIFAARLPGFFTVFIIFVIPRMALALREHALYRNSVYILFTAYTLALYINFYTVWGDKSGFGNYRTVFHKDSVYGFFQE